jgi:hypothetical protein
MSGEAGLASRIKPDSSWIKLEMAGESSTDPPMASSQEEAMDTQQAGAVPGQDSSVDTRPRRQSEGSSRKNVLSPTNEAHTRRQLEGSRLHPPPTSPTAPTPPVIFITGDDEWEKEGESGGGGASGDQVFTNPSSSVKDVGVHHYYSREQIPWHAGKVRNIRDELCRSGSAMDSSSASTSKSNNKEEKEKSGRGSGGIEEGGVFKTATTTVSKASSDTTPSAIQTQTPSSNASNLLPESDMRLLEAVGQVRQANPPPPCESCVDFTALHSSSPAAESMELDDLSRSVYDLEDIPLVPGTVQRTCREIEQRQK